MKLPPGFTATLFASEPMVRQPIDMKVDARGRVWVAEAYWYPDDAGRKQDRITVLEDTDGDGSADKRTIFADGLDHLMSMEIGFGGVWILAPPYLMFCADAEGDMKPDAAPVWHVNGWNLRGQWNMANGLVFGPDGWLYGRQGQLGTSEPVSSRGSTAGRFSTGIWRYRPADGKFEIIANGMTNPWGLDWNEDGELFASGNCNGHLWHIVGGSLYDEGFGSRGFPSEYGRTFPIEAAPHYQPAADWYSAWQMRFSNLATNSTYGGGHSHCGLVICNGSAWPEAMRGHTLMSNIHGHRINEDTIEASASTYLSKRVGDPIKPSDPWFRGVSLVPAPDGALFLSDWSDTGDCHDQEGIHRNSGRIFRITPAPLQAVAAIDLMDDAKLLELLNGEREEPARQALKILQFRARHQKVSSDIQEKLVAMLANPSWKLRLRALSYLHCSELLDEAHFLTASKDADERVRAMAIRYRADERNPDAASDHLVEMASSDPSLRVMLHLASITRLLSKPLARRMGSALIARSENPIDPRIAQLLWHIKIQSEDFSTSDARELIGVCQSAPFANYLARYMVENDGANGVGEIFKVAANLKNPVPVLTAALESARLSRGRMSPPEGWPELRKKWLASPDSALRSVALSAATFFGDSDALDGLAAKITDPASGIAEKTAALETLAAAQNMESLVIVMQAFQDEKLRPAAIHAMRFLNSPAVATRLIGTWASFNESDKRAAIETLVTRKNWAMAVLKSMTVGVIKRDDLTTAQARILAESGDPDLAEAVLKSWGSTSRTTTQKETTIARATALLAKKQTGDPTRGHLLFSQTCATCHTLFNEGGKLGPDLTGRNRADLATLLQSIADPSAQVPEDGRLTIVTRADGSIISGILIAKTESGMVIRSQQEEVRVNNNAIAELKSLTTSPMPEGLLDNLTDTQLADLFAYLRVDQPPIPPK